MPGRNNTRKCLFCEKRMCKHARSKIVYPDLFYIGSIGEGISHRHVRIFTFHSLKRLFELNGFDTILMRGSGFYPDSMGFMSSIMPALSVNIIAVFMKGHIPKNDVKRLLYRELFDNDMEFLRKRLLSRCRCKVCRRGFPGRS